MTRGLHFTKQDLHLWGEFSGDWNPIHFSDLEARSRGLGGIVTHGMLASIPLQEALLGSLEKNYDALKLSLRFRSPVSIGAALTIEVESDDFRRSGTLFSSHNDGALTPCIYGYLFPQNEKTFNNELNLIPLELKKAANLDSLTKISAIQAPLDPIVELGAFAFSLVMRTRGHMNCFDHVQHAIEKHFGASPFAMLQTTYAVNIFSRNSIVGCFGSVRSVGYKSLPITTLKKGGFTSGFMAEICVLETPALQVEVGVSFLPSAKH